MLFKDKVSNKINTIRMDTFIAFAVGVSTGVCIASLVIHRRQYEDIVAWLKIIARQTTARYDDGDKDDF